MQRLIDAARLLCFRVGRYCGGQSECVEAAAKLDAAIQDAEQQAADDAELITDAWAQAELHIGYYGIIPLSHRMKLVLQVDNSVVLHTWDGDGDIYDGTHYIDLPHIKTRGQLRRLIAASKGGE